MKANILIIAVFIAVISCRDKTTTIITPVVEKPIFKDTIVVVLPQDSIKKEDSLIILGPEFVKIPDKAFEMRLVEFGIDSDKEINGKMLRTDAEKVDSLALLHIKGNLPLSLKGLEAFTNLRYLDCRFNNIDSLDVSKNIKLEYLDCSGSISGGGIITNLTKYLKLNSGLKFLYAYFTEFSIIDEGLPPNLKELYLSNDNYYLVNVQKCNNLQVLRIRIIFWLLST